MSGVVHSFTSTKSDGGDATLVRPTDWNAVHVGSPFPLDRYAIDGTYGDDFTASSLSGIWTRRNYTSGAETYQVGMDASCIRIATSGRTNGDGYFQTAPGGNWTFAMAYVLRGNAGINPASSWGIAAIDSSGNGINTAFYQGPPASFMAITVNTYGSYGGSFQASENTYASIAGRKIWVYLRKSSNDYFAAFSLDGIAWGPESSALNRSFTVDRVGMLNGGLGPVTDAAFMDIDWFNKIA